MTKFSDAIQKFDEARKELKSIAEVELKPYLQSLCNDVIIGIKFQCYAPNFNDGDPCNFGLHRVSCRYPGLEEDGGDYEDGYEDYVPDNKEVQTDIDRITEALDAIPLELFELVIGNGYEVIVTKDSVDVSDCDHD
jgi:hypothetical protein